MSVKKEWAPDKSAPTDKTIEQIIADLNENPSEVWEYKNSDGTTHHFRLRYDKPDEKKTVVPLTYGKLGENSGWYKKGPAKPIPLYNLLQIVERNNASSLFVEGEKTADAAAKLFPEYVVTTTAGGANAFNDSDFSPLAGRDVTIWRDADDPGLSYQNGVIKNLTKVGARSISIVDIPEGLPSGFDLADSPPKGFENLDIHGLVKSAIKVDSNQQIALEIKAPFVVKETGVYFISQRNIGGDLLAEETKICSPLDVLALARNDTSQNWSRIVSFKDYDGIEKELMIPASDFAKEGYVQSILQANGLHMHHAKKMRDKVVEYVASCVPDNRLFNTPRTGWHSPAGENVFVLPASSIGRQKVKLYPSLSKNPYAAKGSLQCWQDTIGHLAKGNSRLITAISASLCGPLLKPLGMESFGINLFGSSSSGKTTCLQVAATTWGWPADIILQWRSTDNGLEAVATRNCDTTIFLDELGACDPDVLSKSIYMLMNNKGKLRATQDGSAARTNDWNLAMVSSGELTLAEKIMQGRSKRVYAGQSVRFVDISADAGQGMGAFENLHGYESSKKFSEALKNLSSKHYGQVAPMFIEHLTQKHFVDLQEEFAGFSVAFLRHYPGDLHPQVQRALGRFIAIAFAGHVGIQCGVLPWSEDDLMAGIQSCAQSWLNSCPNSAMSGDVSSGIKHLQTFLKVNADTCFHVFTNRAAGVNGLVTDGSIPRGRTYGYRKLEDGQESICYVFPDVLKREILADYNVKDVMNELAKAGHLKTGEDNRLSLKARIPGFDSPQRVYAIKQSIFDMNVESEAIIDE